MKYRVVQSARIDEEFNESRENQQKIVDTPGNMPLLEPAGNPMSGGNKSNQSQTEPHSIVDVTTPTQSSQKSAPIPTAPKPVTSTIGYNISTGNGAD